MFLISCQFHVNIEQRWTRTWESIFCFSIICNSLIVTLILLSATLKTLLFGWFAYISKRSKIKPKTKELTRPTGSSYLDYSGMEFKRREETKQRRTKREKTNEVKDEGKEEWKEDRLARLRDNYYFHKEQKKVAKRITRRMRKNQLQSKFNINEI
jgi:hypothetical protein